MNRSKVYEVWRDRTPEEMTTGVSLHSHTSRSKETLGFIPKYVNKVPYLAPQIKKLEDKFERHHGHRFDYRNGWWTPPLEPLEAFRLERTQIEQKMGRQAMVSLTDHDSVEAGYALELFPETKGTPISVEWTVPTVLSNGEHSFLHLGVHNLGSARAHMLMGAMREVTANPTPSAVDGMFEELASNPETLVVLNHPLWDEARMGYDLHVEMVKAFLGRHGKYIHAIELNGLRNRAENRNVMKLAEEWSKPLVGGGDRHGCEPNALTNLTAAKTFGDFVAEIRDGAPTHTVYLEQYNEPFKMRVMQVMSDVMRTYEEFPEGRRRWSDRIFFQQQDGTVRRLSDVWKGNGPGVVCQFVTAMRLFESRRVKAVLRFALSSQSGG